MLNRKESTLYAFIIIKYSIYMGAKFISSMGHAAWNSLHHSPYHQVTRNMLFVTHECAQCSKKSFMTQKHCLCFTFRPEKRARVWKHQQKVYAEDKWNKHSIAEHMTAFNRIWVGGWWKIINKTTRKSGIFIWQSFVDCIWFLSDKKNIIFCGKKSNVLIYQFRTFVPGIIIGYNGVYSLSWVNTMKIGIVLWQRYKGGQNQLSFQAKWRRNYNNYQKLTATEIVSMVNAWLRMKNPPKNIRLSPNRRAFK